MHVNVVFCSIMNFGIIAYTHTLTLCISLSFVLNLVSFSLSFYFVFWFLWLHLNALYLFLVVCNLHTYPSNIRVRSALNCKKSERLPAMTLSRHSHSKWYRAAIITSIKHRPKACLICSVLLSSSPHISSHACLPACLLGCLLGKWRYAVCVCILLQPSPYLYVYMMYGKWFDSKNSAPRDDACFLH